jgi:hypothetical protein
MRLDFITASVVSLVALVPLVPLVACGGATQSDLFGGSSSADSGAALDGNSNGIVDSGSGHDASSGDDAGTNRDSGVIPVDAGGPPDTGGPPPPPPPPDAGGDPGIYCGRELSNDVYCPVNQQECCVTGQGSSAIVFKCEAVGAATCVGVPARCDDTADCPGTKVCCGTFDAQQQQYQDVTCRSSCTATGLRRFCDQALQPSDCPQGQTCGPSQLLIGYHVCQ